MAEQKRSLKVMPGHTSCWPRDLRNSIESRGGSFPSYTLRQDVRNFLAQEPSIRDHLDLAEDGSVMWVLLEFHVEFDTHSSGRQIEPFMETWESFVVQAGKDLDQLYSGSAYPLGPAFPSTSLFERAEAENRVVNSALSSWLVSVGCALAALVVFTRSLWLSVIATFAMFATAACSLFFITSVFHWHFGLMEAVSLIIFCGFSVDYPLHVVQAYVQERDRGAGVRGALREVGGAVVSGCLTTCGAASFLLLCQIRLFTRFGQVLVVNMIFALIFALVWIPAVLECTTCGGGADESRKRPPLHQSDDAGFGRGLLHSGGTGTGRSLSEELDEVSSGFTVLGGGTPRGSRRS
ncbi:unnamed protein product [Polarella glacialis]|uniref:Membrane transport protein MMPL domain-containing protein n=1 Tax=Polarella glacialis TaxID=89957 RepID=A0A813JCD7_POLGL|nr:unnamed protein product [Polarella glacialis]